MEGVIYEFTDDTYQVVMEDCVNEELDDIKLNGLIEENKPELHDEQGKISL